MRPHALEGKALKLSREYLLTDQRASMGHFLDVCIGEVVNIVKYYMDQIGERDTRPKLSWAWCPFRHLLLIRHTERLSGRRFWRVRLPATTNWIHLESLGDQVSNSAHIADSRRSRRSHMRYLKGQDQEHEEDNVLQKTFVWRTPRNSHCMCIHLKHCASKANQVVFHFEAIAC